MAKRKRSGSSSSSRPYKRARTALSLKRPTLSRTMLKRKRRYTVKKFVNNKRKWRARKRVMKTTLSTQPYWVDSANMASAINILAGRVNCGGGLAPIGAWSGAADNNWPYPNTADASNQYSDLTRIASKIGVFDGSTGVFTDQGQNILIDYSKVQYNIRNNTNIALNLRLFHFRPRNNFSTTATNVRSFSELMQDVVTDAGLTFDKLTPQSHPTDFPRFNKFYKIFKQKNVRLLPGENIFVSQVTLKKRMMNSSKLNTIIAPKFARFFGIMVNGDPVHDSLGGTVTLSSGRLDVTATYKLKFRRLDAPTVQNKVFLDNDLVNLDTTAQEHVAAFANVVNNVDL